MSMGMPTDEQGAYDDGYNDGFTEGRRQMAEELAEWLERRSRSPLMGLSKRGQLQFAADYCRALAKEQSDG